MIIKDYDLPLLRRALGKELMLARWQKRNLSKTNRHTAKA